VDVRADAPVAPDAPAGLAVTGTPDSLRATWRAPASLGGGSLAGYDAILDDADTGEPVRAAATDRTSIDFAGLARHRYVLRVRAVAEGGAGPAAERAIDLRAGEARPARGSEVAPPPQLQPKQALAARRPAGLRVIRARVRKGRLSALARIAREARGTVRVAYRAAGRTIAFRGAIRGGTIRFHHRLPSRMSRRRGRLKLSYAGDASLLPAASALGCRPAPRAPATRAPSRSSA
jgi:Fibronectin type III domain